MILKKILDITKRQGKPSGLYVRNDLKEIVERVEKEGKERVVGIVFTFGEYIIEDYKLRKNRK